MRHRLLRILLSGWIVVATVISLPFILMSLDAVLMAVGVDDDQASFAPENGAVTLTVRRRPHWHPILGNEFYRSLIVSRDGRKILHRELPMDTGGYAMIQVYALENQRLLLTDGIDCQILDLPRRELTTINKAVVQRMTFLGAFDQDADYNFHFFTSKQRSPAPFLSNIVPNCLWGGNTPSLHLTR